VRTVNRSRRQRRRGGVGQSLVELALIGPLLLVLIVGGAQIGALVYGGISVATAAQEAARVASEQPIKSAAYMVSGASTAVGPGATCPAAGNPVCAAVSQAKGLLSSVNTTIAPGTAPGTGTGCPPKSVGDGYITVTVAVNVPIFIPILNNVLASAPGGAYRTMSDTVTVRVEPCTLTNGS
jgi:Flp pilus assembly protein TadG